MTSGSSVAAALWPEFPTQRGTYALLLRVEVPLSVQVGKLGHFTLGSGLYLYVGSAYGAGGLRARLKRHVRAEKKLHWHIDALTVRVPVAAVAWRVAPQRMECVWAKHIEGVAGVHVPIVGFGASDCHCQAHFFGVPGAQLGAVWKALTPTRVVWQKGLSAFGGDVENKRAPQQ